ncbi:bifunctional helix-turn-helix transcriptional regulator/GNAT family N-acetyltransferase [Mucilaginibacter jinjuensis]|uniref:GNAT family N-acetyltransferase n=1 Tax=Mucilaginibacter jinjuensis TaxID=1176721 RepID=A0ABY7T7Y4_9SPHI|nr:GNAT family N-acetyltransferase [Mucilaginibacter jinjuensis]WCT11976.1 GNAT family N-acetyltransferase [Mucilaginibacter jinjuensis]
MEFYNKVGRLALGSRMRRLTELHMDQASKVYALYNVEMQPKWFPVYYSLCNGEEKTITLIAQEIGHSHPSVSTIVKEMTKKGIVKESPYKGDGRKNYVMLTEKGLSFDERLQEQFMDVNTAIEEALAETQHNLWKAIEEWEYILEQRSLDKRVIDAKKQRESRDVTIVEYDPKYQADFRRLNEEWITTYFKMEPADYQSLDHAKEYILDKGGYIYLALLKGEPIGTCALIKMNDDTYELAKMAVSPLAKGKGVGNLLGNTVVEKAKSLGAKKIYLESNMILKPAINLYQKLGFKKVLGNPSPYERCNIQMELNLAYLCTEIR